MKFLQLAYTVNSGMCASHGRIRLHPHSISLPFDTEAFTQLFDQILRILAVPSAELFEKASVFLFKYVLDPNVTTSGQEGDQKTIASSKTVLHTFDFASKLRGHQPTSLGTRNLERILNLCRCEIKQSTNTSSRCRRSKNSSGMPAGGENVRPMERKTYARSDLIPDDGGKQNI
jgi:hypothetical protein